MVSRANARRSRDWWWTVDRLMLAALLALMLAGIVLSLAGEPAGRRAARASTLPFRQPADPLSRPGARW